ncbi:SCO family protein [Shewanella sp. AS1]|nr:SCO family protein [Shewanella sp. AS1]
MNVKKIVMVAIMLLFTVLGGVAATHFSSSSVAQPALSTSFIFPTARPVSAFSLTDQYGQPFDNARLLNKWSLIFVGYTSCPDVCPTTMNKLASVYKALAGKVDLQVVFISVDPGRDNQQKLLDYINFFNPDFVAATAAHSQLLPLTRELGFVYSMVGEGANYQVDHSASLVLISPKGERYAIIKPSADKAGEIPQIKRQNLIVDLEQINQFYRG